MVFLHFCRRRRGAPAPKKSNPRVVFPLFGQKVPRGVGARAGPGHLWCQWWMPGWSPPQMRMLSGSLGAKQSKSDVIWGGGWVPTHQRTKREPRIFQGDHGNSLWRHRKHFCANVAKSFKNQCETEGAGSHQSLWKPFRFWFGSLTFWDGGFGATVSHLMVPELEQRSARPARSAGRKNESTFILFSKK